jgi:hypothetical protein
MANRKGPLPRKSASVDGLRSILTPEVKPTGKGPTGRRPGGSPATKPKVGAKGAGGPRPLPLSSVARAKKAFKNFTLSRHGSSPPPATHVTKERSLIKVQKEAILRSLATYAEQENPNPGMTIALPPAAMKKLMPSFNARENTVDLDQLMTVVQRYMRGTTFHARGNATLNRLSVQSQVFELLNSIKGGVS